MPDVVAWFRRDLRLADNHVLTDAVERAGPDGRVIPLFVVDPELDAVAGDNRRWFLAGALASLDRDLHELGSALVVRHGDPAQVVTELARDHDIDAVLHAQDVGVYGRARDAAVADALGPVELIEADTPWLVPPGTIRTESGQGFKVFGAFHRRWRERLAVGDELLVPAAGSLGDPAGRRRGRVATDAVPEPPDVTAALPEPGEAAAHDRLEAFVADDLDDYDAGRDVLAGDGSSRLSPYLRFGCLHPRQAARLLASSADHERFLTELAWRDFYADVLFHRPDSARHDWSPALAEVRTDRGRVADERFAAWCAGQTGYPVVDAGMRQLLAEGWMHNRARMITASFLVKDLHLPWQRGARHFMRHLVDGDLASNQHGWQWVAGTGTDAAPFHRVFNPTRQGERFDADGAYVRRYVPELATMPDRYVHEPWRSPLDAPDYPPPIVDHATERAEALARYAAR